MRTALTLAAFVVLFIVGALVLALTMRGRTPRVWCVQCGHPLTGAPGDWRSARNDSRSCWPPGSAMFFSRHRAEDDPHPFGTGHSTPPPPPARIARGHHKDCAKYTFGWNDCTCPPGFK